MLNAEFWASQRVLLTGHTGFKGAWLSLWLERLGAETFGFALAPDQTPSLYAKIEPIGRLHSIIRSKSSLKPHISSDLRDWFIDHAVKYDGHLKPVFKALGGG